MGDYNTVTYPVHKVWRDEANHGGETRVNTPTGRLSGPPAPPCTYDAIHRVAELEEKLANAIEQISEQNNTIWRLYNESENYRGVSDELSRAVEQISEQNSTIEELYNESEKHRDSAKLLSKWIRKRMKKYGTVGPVEEVVSLKLTKSELINMVTEAVSTSVAASVDMNRDVIDLTGDE